MHQKDIELARLLIARESELRARDEALRDELNGVQIRVDEAKEQREQRDAYADILAQAADLLQRSDLTVEAPDTAPDEQRLAELSAELATLEGQERQFQELVAALKERAPQLFDAATGALRVDADTPAEAVDGMAGSADESAGDAAEAAEPAAQDAAVPEPPAGSAASDMLTAEAESEAEAEPAPAAEPGLEPEAEAVAEAAAEAEPAGGAEPEPAIAADAEAASAPAPEPEMVVAASPAPQATPRQPAPVATAAPGVNSNVADDWDESVALYVAGRGQAVPQDADNQYAWTAPAAENGAGPHASEPDEPLTSEELERFLQRFNLDLIEKETTEVLGGEAVYVIDAASVLDNIPYYDREIRGGPVRFIRDELLRDIDLLGRHLKGQVYLVLDQPSDSELKLSSNVALRELSPADKGRRDAAEELFKKVLAEAGKGGQAVCFVTGDLGLGGSMRSRRVHFFPLGDFFRT